MKLSSLRIAAGLFGAFVAAIAAEAVLMLGYTGIWLLLAWPIHNANVSDGTIFIVVTAIYAAANIALPVMLLVALPYVVISNRLKHSSRNYYLWSGIVMGLLVFVVSEFWRHRLPGPPYQIDFEVLFSALSYMVCGTVSAWTFWSIARPDRSQLQSIATNV